MSEVQSQTSEYRLPVVDEVVNLESDDGVVDAEVGARGERDEAKVEREAGLLNLANELGQLRVSPGAVEDLKGRQRV